MTDDIMNKLDELQSICEAATQGRWDWLLCVDKSTPSVLISRGEDGTMYTTISSLWLDEEDGLSDMSKEDAAFIKAAREYMPQLIEALKKVSK